MVSEAVLVCCAGRLQFAGLLGPVEQSGRPPAEPGPERTRMQSSQQCHPRWVSTALINPNELMN